MFAEVVQEQQSLALGPAYFSTVSMDISKAQSQSSTRHDTSKLRFVRLMASSCLALQLLLWSRLDPKSSTFSDFPMSCVTKVGTLTPFSFQAGKLL